MDELRLALAVTIGGFIVAPLWVYIMARMIFSAYFQSFKQVMLTSKESECPRFGISQ